MLLIFHYFWQQVQIDKEDVKKYYLKDSEKENLKKEIDEFVQ